MTKQQIIQKTIEHYNRMIKWASTRPAEENISGEWIKNAKKLRKQIKSLLPKKTGGKK